MCADPVDSLVVAIIDVRRLWVELPRRLIGHRPKVLEARVHLDERCVSERCRAHQSVRVRMRE
jgi:hypothetical protein